MSAPPISPIPTTPGNISDVVSQQDLTTWAQIAGVLKYLTAPLTPPPAPGTGYTGSPQVTQSVFQNTYAALSSAGVDVAPSYLEAAKHAAAAGNVGWWAAAAIAFVSMFLLPAAEAMLIALGALRKGIDPAVGELAVEVLNEFLGTDITAAQMPLGIGTGDHLARGQAIGQVLLGQLESEFAQAGGGGLQPSIAAAETFSGLAVNFGLASGIMGIIGGMIPYGHWDELRELGEEVAKNIGLGRLVRRALQPLVQILVTQPATWYYNTKYLPTQFSIGDVVNPFTQSVMPTAQVFKALNLLGYSNDKIQALIELHQKKISPADVQLLINYGFWSQTDGQNYTARDGWPTGFAGTVLTLEGLRETKGWITKEVDLLLTEVGSGLITIDEFAQIIDQFALSQPVKNVIVALANYRGQKAKLHKPKTLSDGQLAIAFEAGIVTIDDVTSRWAAEGYSQQDIQTKTVLLLLKLNRLEDVVKEKQAEYQQKAADVAAKNAGQKPATPEPQPPIPPFPLGS